MFTLQELGRLEESEEALRAAVKLAPRNPGNMHTLALVLGQRAKHNEAVEVLQRALALRCRTHLQPGLHRLSAKGASKPPKEFMSTDFDADNLNPDRVSDGNACLRAAQHREPGQRGRRPAHGRRDTAAAFPCEVRAAGVTRRVIYFSNSPLQ